MTQFYDDFSVSKKVYSIFQINSTKTIIDLDLYF